MFSRLLFAVVQPPFNASNSYQAQFMPLTIQFPPHLHTQRCCERRSLPSSSQRKQSGVVLITVALFLVVLAALGAASMRAASVQERIAGVFYDHTVSLTAADAALSDGMEFLSLHR